jgi:NADH-quinone oxidoreductase subunit N
VPTSTLTDIQNLIAPILVTVVGMLVLLMDVGTGAEGRRRLLPLLSIVSLIGAAALALVAGYPSTTAPAGQQAITSFAGGMVSDRLGAFFTVVMCLAAALAIGMSSRYLEERHLKSGEFYALILFSAAGGMFMALAYDLVNVFVGLEVLSVALYILSGFARRERRSEESAVKYFLLGAFASGFLLYGMALIYGAVGLAVVQQGIQIDGVSYTNLGVIGQALHESTLKGAPIAASPIFVTGVALLIVGLGFKAAIVPFHSYAPDVYEGAPTPVTAFMSVGAKVGAFAALMRFAHVLANAGDGGAEPFRFVVWTLAVATMLVGNILAVRQTNIKRMLAYSSIAHAGYLLVGVLASGVPVAFEYANQAVVYYLFVYALMNLGAFGLVVWLGRSGGGEYLNISDYAGLARRKPWAAAAMSLFMLSLAGIPPAAGFLGKLYLFMSAVTAGYGELAVIGLIISAIGVFYYLNIILTMYFREPAQEFTEAQPGGARLVVAICALATLVFGVAPIPGVAPLPERPAVVSGMLGNTPTSDSVTPPGLRAPGLVGPRTGTRVQPMVPAAPGGAGGPGSPP